MSVPVILSAIVGLAVVGSAKSLHPGWWARRAFRYGLIVFAALVPFGMLLRMLGLGRLMSGFTSAPVSMAGGMIGGGGAIILLSLLFGLPSAGLLRAVFKRASPNPEPGRRRVLEAVVAAVPLALVGVAATGIAGAFASTRVVERRMTFANLPADLAGLRIAQITDLHLGAFHSPSMLPKLVDLVSAQKPDLLLLTGDICDYLPWLEDALDRFTGIGARLGTFAVFGNHEYYRGALSNRRLYEKKGIDLLLDGHRALSIGRAKLLLLGVDDASSAGPDEEFYPRHADATLSSAPSDADFTIAMCHRPKGFRALSERGVDLTLSGHTHGAQTGFGERSVLEPVMSDSYLWGKYEHAGKQLYTSSGAGHWAAFRLACPSEVPLVVLEQA